MDGFIQRHKKKAIGVLNGLDRIRFRGTRRLLACVGGMRNYLYQRNVLLKDFTTHVVVTARIRQAVIAAAEARGLSVQYLPSSSIRKKDVALGQSLVNGGLRKA